MCRIGMACIMAGDGTYIAGEGGVYICISVRIQKRGGYY